MGNDIPLDMRLMAKDKDVIIIGGGDTGCDCIATSLRQVKLTEIQVAYMHICKIAVITTFFFFLTRTFYILPRLSRPSFYWLIYLCRKGCQNYHNL